LLTHVVADLKESELLFGWPEIALSRFPLTLLIQREGPGFMLIVDFGNMLDDGPIDSIHNVPNNQ
jgi:hypothetical protein